MVCSIVIVICAAYNFKTRYALLVIMASDLWASNGLSLSYASVSCSDMEREVKAISLALVNLFPNDDEPKYFMGFGQVSSAVSA